jgi:cell division protein FtsN
MSRDYKSSSPKSNGNRGGGSLLVGILIGLVLGLGIALAVAWYINKMPTPFLSHGTPPKDLAKVAPPKAQPPVTQAPDAKPRFEFYKILPGIEEPATDQQVRDAQQRPAAEKETFFLQAGAFQSAPDAEQRKAQLALLGVDATIQTTVLPDKTVWHRVRVGPYTAVEEINRVRDVLKQGGVETTLIKAREPANHAAK